MRRPERAEQRARAGDCGARAGRICRDDHDGREQALLFRAVLAARAHWLPDKPGDGGGWICGIVMSEAAAQQQLQ